MTHKINNDMIDKDVRIQLLEIVSAEFKIQTEENTCERSRNKYGEWYKQLLEMINTMSSGGIK